MRLLAGLRRAWLAALVLALGLSGSALGAPEGQVSEFPTPSTSSEPEGMVAGPDGNLWFAEFGASRIAEVNPTTDAITEFLTPTLNSFPLGITMGPDGNMWFTEFVADKIGEINPTTDAITEFPVPTASTGPVAITAGPDGNMWFTESAAPGRIGEINPSTHAITEFPVPTASSGPFGIAAGPDGNIWFTEKAPTHSQIGMINPMTHAITEFPTPTVSSEPNAIAAGPNGSLWFTEQASTVNRIGLIDPTSHMITEFPTSASPAVITPGPNGNMWFTEGVNPGKVASINPVTHAITEFPTPTADSAPVGIATGSDGNLWFTEFGAGKVGSIGAGAPAASVTAPSVTGDTQPGSALSCQGETWSSWAGLQPSLSAFGFDGFQWLRDGAAIADVTSSYTAGAGDVGHQLSCRTTATYPLLSTTVSALSPAVTVSPVLGASLTGAATSGTTLLLSFSCQGLPTQTCSGPISVTSKVTTQGSKIVAVAAKAKKKPKPKPKPKPKVTKVETIASGSYSVATGHSVTVALTLNSTGKKLLSTRYRLPGVLAVGGTSPTTRTVTFSYGRLHLSPSFTWAFGKAFSFATELTVNHLPKQSKVTVICHGHGCPFSKRTFAAPKNGTLKLASALKQRHLSPHATVELEITATNVVGEVVIFTIVSGKQPTETFRCLPPGARTPTACA